MQRRPLEPWEAGDEYANDTPTLMEHHINRVSQNKLSQARFWHLTILVFSFGTLLAVAFLAFLYNYKPITTLEITSSETRLIEPNTWIYKSIELTGTKLFLSSDLPNLTHRLGLDSDSGINTFLYREPPDIKIHGVNISQDFSVPKDHYKFWARYSPNSSHPSQRPDFTAYQTPQ